MNLKKIFGRVSDSANIKDIDNIVRIMSELAREHGLQFKCKGRGKYSIWFEFPTVVTSDNRDGIKFNIYLDEVIGIDYLAQRLIYELDHYARNVENNYDYWNEDAYATLEERNKVYRAFINFCDDVIDHLRDYTEMTIETDF